MNLDEPANSENCYDPNNEYLNFEESNICLNVNHLRRVYLFGVLIRHYRKNDANTNCYQNKITYLHSIFKEYLVRTAPEHIDKETKQNTVDQRKRVRRIRSSFIAQFQPNTEQIKTDLVGCENFPTYVVSFQLEMFNKDSNMCNNIIQIAFRLITRQSFLINVLDCFGRPVWDQTIRRCVIIESNPNIQVDNSDNRFLMRACSMAITPKQQMINKRLFLVAKHGWLAVFLNNYSDAFLLLEDEYLIFPSQLKNIPIFYERILDMNHTNEWSEMFYRRTSINHDQYSCNGMIISRGVIQNDFTPDFFLLIGLGNAIINFTYFQQLLTFSNDNLPMF